MHHHILSVFKYRRILLNIPFPNNSIIQAAKLLFRTCYIAIDIPYIHWKKRLILPWFLHQLISNYTSSLSKIFQNPHRSPFISYLHTTFDIDISLGNNFTTSKSPHSSFVWDNNKNQFCAGLRIAIAEGWTFLKAF